MKKIFQHSEILRQFIVFFYQFFLPSLFFLMKNYHETANFTPHSDTTNKMI